MGNSNSIPKQNPDISRIHSNSEATTPTSLSSISPLQSQMSYPPSKIMKDIVSKNTINNKSFEIKIKKGKIKQRKPVLIDRKSINNTKINNGVTGVYISSKVATLAGIFWNENIARLERYDQLEIGCAIYFRMITESKHLRKKLKKEKIELTGLRFVEMLTWLLSAVIREDINLFQTLNKLGLLHKQWNINKSDYELMIYCVHETMQEYFPNKYEIDIKFSMEHCLTVCMSIMRGDFQFLTSFNNSNINITKLQLIQSGGFLKSYDICVNTDIGREYLYRFLGQTWCSEIVVFLQLLHKYDTQDNDKGKFIIAKDILKKCLTHGSTFEINVSYDCFQNFQENMQELEREFSNKGESFRIKPGLLSTARREIKKLIVSQRWKGFVDAFKKVNVS